MIRFYDTNASYRLEVGSLWIWLQVDWWYDGWFRHRPWMPLEITFWNAKKNIIRLHKQIKEARDGDKTE